MVTPTELGETIVGGDTYTFTVTLTKDGATYDLGGFTVTCSIRPDKGRENVITEHAVTITDAANGVVTLVLTSTETATLAAPVLRDTTRTVLHIGDFKVDEGSSVITHCGPFSFPVRGAIT